MELKYRIKDGQIQLKAKYLGEDCKYHVQGFRIDTEGTQDISILEDGIEYFRQLIKGKEVPYCQCFPVTFIEPEATFKSVGNCVDIIWKQLPNGDFRAENYNLPDMPIQTAVNLRDNTGKSLISEEDLNKMGY